MVYSNKIKSTFCHQETLALHVWNNYIFCGVGSFIHIYNENFSIVPVVINVFHGQKVHFLRNSLHKNFLFVVGGRDIALLYVQTASSDLDVTIQRKHKSYDWTHDLCHFNENKIVLVNAHNQAELWSFDPLQLIQRVTTQLGPCILYTATVFFENGVIHIFAGTVFSEILVWNADFSQETAHPEIKHRISGHTGVIFSIEIQRDRDLFRIISTSDDRSVRVTEWSPEVNDWQQRDPLYGHTSRVWNSCYSDGKLFTIGEDSIVTCWRDNCILGKLVLHGGAGLRAITTCNDGVLTGGSNGGIFHIPKKAFEARLGPRILFENTKEQARKVVGYGFDEIACLTNRKLIYCRKSEYISFNAIEHGLLNNCTDMKISSDGILALSTTCGHIITINTKVITNFSPLVVPVGKGERCDAIFWSGPYLLVQMNTGMLRLFDSKIAILTEIATFRVRQLKQKCVTCFLRIDSKTMVGILIGNRMGSLDLFQDANEVRVDTCRVHSYGGVNDLLHYNDTDTIFSIGTGGWLKELKIEKNIVVPIRSFMLPMETGSKIIPYRDRIILAGFHGANLIVWDLQNQLTLVSYNCGGGHRSYTLSVHEDTVYFAFIKDKKLFKIDFEINFGTFLRNGFHSKVINCLEVIEGVLVSGSDDNSIRVSTLKNSDITEMHTFQNHISGVKGIKVHQLKDGIFLVIAVGGREQLSLSEIDIASGQCIERLSYRNSDDANKATTTDSRFMCVDCKKINNDAFLIYIGCSDCTIKVFSLFKDVLTLDIELRYTHCILQIISLEKWIISFGTDGKAVFWDLDQNRAVEGSHAKLSMDLHQSGVNAATVMKWNGTSDYLLATGGDDNRLCLTSFNDECHELSRWYTDSCHSCQITGIVLRECWMVTTSIDQRVALHRVEGPNNTRAIWQADSLVTVPDVHGLSLINATEHLLVVCVFGKGVEVLEIEIQKDCSQDPFNPALVAIK